jgi:hypothetical protein
MINAKFLWKATIFMVASPSTHAAWHQRPPLSTGEQIFVGVGVFAVRNLFKASERGHLRMCF